MQLQLQLQERRVRISVGTLLADLMGTGEGKGGKQSDLTLLKQLSRPTVGVRAVSDVGPRS